MVEAALNPDAGLNLTAQPQKTTTKLASESKINSAFKKLKGVKNIEIIIAVIAVVVMLVIYFSSKITLGANESPSSATTGTDENYCGKMERELTESLSKLKGAGQVSVIINWESSVESIIAYATNTSSNSAVSTPQIITSNGSGKPIVLKEIYPKALGVVIICQGGDNVSVKLDIINAVSTLLNITPEKIHVLTMSK